MLVARSSIESQVVGLAERCSISCQSKLLTNSSAFSRRLNVESDGADRMCALRLFHVRAAVTVNERSPRVTRRVDGTSRADVDPERSRSLEPISATR